MKVIAVFFMAVVVVVLSFFAMSVIAADRPIETRDFAEKLSTGDSVTILKPSDVSFDASASSEFTLTSEKNYEFEIREVAYRYISSPYKFSVDDKITIWGKDVTVNIDSKKDFTVILHREGSMEGMLSGMFVFDLFIICILAFLILAGGDKSEKKSSREDYNY